MPNLQPFGGSPRNRYLGSLKPTQSSAPVPTNLPSPVMTNLPGKLNAIASNQGATPTTPPQITPATKAPTTARDQYMSSMTSSPTTVQTPQTYTTPSGARVTPEGQMVQAPQSQTPQKEDPTQSYRTAFDEYLKSLKPSEEETRASKNLADLDLQAMRDQEKALGMGETLGFATGEAARVNKENAFQRMAAANTLDSFTRSRGAMTEAQKARLDFEKSLLDRQPKNEGFTLGKDQVRYGADGSVIARGPGESTSTGAYEVGANPTVDAYVKMVQSGSLKLDGVPAEIRGSVAQGLAASPATDDPKKQYVKSQADTALTSIDTALGILEGKTTGGFNSAGTALGRTIGQLIPGSDVTNLNAALDTVKALVGFDALQKMRESSPTGGALGQITERELAFLQSVQGSLSTSQGTQQLKDTIARIRQSFQTLQIVNSPDGTEFELNGQKYIKQGNQMIPASFSSAGNASASNRPQRNNNPLNIKKSGVTSAYPGVSGVDPSPATDGGQFLTFNTPEAGFAAAKRLIQSDSYKNLSVDAAMKRWSGNGYGGEIMPQIANKKVSQLTPKELDSLIQTMARREGYYA